MQRLRLGYQKNKEKAYQEAEESFFNSETADEL